MRTIYYVTSNKGKLASAKKALSDMHIEGFEADLVEPRSDDLRTIAKEKVKQAYELTGEPCIAMDSGFFINAWNGFPGTYVNPTLDKLGLEGILNLMHDIEDRSCSFKECLAFYDGKELVFFESEAPGHLATKIQGEDKENKWSDLWYIFKPLDFEKTLAEFTDEDFDMYRKKSSLSSIQEFGYWWKEDLQRLL